MRARDQCTIFSTGGKFHPDYGLLLELHALTLVVRSYALLTYVITLFAMVALMTAWTKVCASPRNLI